MTTLEFGVIVADYVNVGAGLTTFTVELALLVAPWLSVATTVHSRTSFEVTTTVDKSIVASVGVVVVLG